ncbi:glycosyltransferase [Qipengyuania soli]|uniref:Glycosyltransferase n=1 Tax=Qipengyuania soli TaxID=2782568 RepID=A0A7S8IU74_9SPHN|nr:glycosyltransferase [Qipengyuania soli]QPC98025.1 glycosyltransferase [Qipengyuania soli]
MTGKRIGLLSAWASRANGGIFEAVIAQADLLRSLGAIPVVIAVEDEAHEKDRHRLEGFEVRLARRTGPKVLAYSPELDGILADAKLDLLHLHGIWQFPSHAAGKWARRTGKPMLLSPHGMLDPWITRRNRWKKLPARMLWEHRAWRSANAFHALTEAEAHDSLREVPGMLVSIIPNMAPPPGPSRTSMPSASAIYLGRIHEKKNIGALIEAWRLARPHLPQDAHLTIAGWGDDASIDALNRAFVAGEDSIDFVGTVFESQKAALFDMARFFVLPTKSEGLPVTVLEAWAAGTPTIMTEACHLHGGYAEGAAIACSTEPDGIAAKLVEAFAMTETQWRAMSRAAQRLAGETFGRDAVLAQWEATYAALIRG